MQVRAPSGCSTNCSLPLLRGRPASLLCSCPRRPPTALASRRVCRPSVAAIRHDAPPAADAAGGTADGSWRTRLAACLAAAALSVCLTASPAVAAAEPFLTATGKQRPSGMMRMRMCTWPCCHAVSRIAECCAARAARPASRRARRVIGSAHTRLCMSCTCAGAQGLLRDQEAELFKLRQEAEQEVRLCE